MSSLRRSAIPPLATAATAVLALAAPKLAFAAPSPSSLPGTLTASWIGNSLADRGSGLRVPTMLDQFGVWPDGTCWLQSHYNEGGAGITLINGKTGAAVGHADGLPVPGPKRADGSHTYYYVSPNNEGLCWHGFDGKEVIPGAGYMQSAANWTPPGDPHKLFPDQPGGLHYHNAAHIGRGGNLLWVTDTTDYASDPTGGMGSPVVGRIWLIDAQTRRLIRWFAAPNAEQISTAANGLTAWYVAGDALIRVNAAGRQIARVAPLPAPALGLAALPDGGCLVTGWGWHGVARYAADGARRADVPLTDTFSPKASPKTGSVAPGTIDAPVGVGVDASGSLYVACSDACLPKLVRVDRYPSDGRGGWDLSRGARVCWGGTFGDCWKTDPTDPTLRWSSIGVVRMDWSQGPGREQRLIGISLDLTHNPSDPRRWLGCQGGAGRSCLGVVVLGGHRFLYTTVAGDWDVYRLPDPGQGFVARPCAMYAFRDVAIERAEFSAAPPNLPRTGFFWHDANGDGRMSAKSEFETWSDAESIEGPHEYALTTVDSAGNVWSTPCHTRDDWTLGPVLKFGFTRDERGGDPIYSRAQVVRYPLPQASRYGHIGFSGVTRSGDLWVLGQRDGAKSYSLAYWPGWVRAGCPGGDAAAPAWVVRSIADTTRAAADWAHWDRSVGTIDAAGDYLFLCEGINATVRVYRRKDGTYVGRMTTDLAHNSTQDGSSSFEAWRRENGEYDITVMGYLENVNVLYRWTPPKAAAAPRPKTGTKKRITT